LAAREPPQDSAGAIKCENWLLLALAVRGSAQAMSCQGRDFVLDSLTNGRAVTAERNYAGGSWGALRARAIGHDEWERLHMACVGGDQFAICAYASGLYVTAELWQDRATGCGAA
jgi:hypothetical protein